MAIMAIYGGAAHWQLWGRRRPNHAEMSYKGALAYVD